MRRQLKEHRANLKVLVHQIPKVKFPVGHVQGQFWILPKPSLIENGANWYELQLGKKGKCRISFSYIFQSDTQFSSCRCQARRHVFDCYHWSKSKSKLLHHLKILFHAHFSRVGSDVETSHLPKLKIKFPAVTMPGAIPNFGKSHDRLMRSILMEMRQTRAFDQPCWSSPYHN